MREMDKLKPCPFCGSNELVSSCCALDYPTTNVRAYIDCECGATIRRDGRVADSRKLLAGAIEAWNMRTNATHECELRPATKFVNATLFQHNDKFAEEFDEVQAAFYDCTEDFIEKNKEHLIEEIIDVQLTGETWLAGLGLDAEQRGDARRKVIAKNAARGYYDGI